MRASERAYETLKSDIIENVLAPGALLGEIETAARVGVSRTPVREAFARLAAEGLVTSAGRSIRVAPLSRAHVIALYELREALELQAAKLAARRRDPAKFAALLDEFGEGADPGADAGRPYLLASELDEAIVEAAASRYISAELEDLRGQMARIRHHARSDPDRLQRATDEHLLIARAILAGDETLAMHATAVHLAKSLMNILASMPDDDAVVETPAR